MFDMPEHWDPDDDPHPNTKLVNKLVYFGNKYINRDPSGSISFSASSGAINIGKGMAQSNTYTPPSQQANNQGLLANITKPATEILPEMGSFSFKAPKAQKPAVTQRQGKDNYTTPPVFSVQTGAQFGS